MVRNHLDDQAMSKLLMKSTHHKKVLEAHKIVLVAHKKVLEAHKIVLEAHKSFRFSSNFKMSIYWLTLIFPDISPTTGYIAMDQACN